MTLTPDLAEARRFLAILAPDGNAVFQTFDDDEDRKAPRLAFTTRGFDSLEGMNNKRAGIFITINEVVGDRRKAEFVTRPRALFADFDGVDLPDHWDIEPSILVNTSPGKFHAYWLCDDFPKEEFPDAQRAIAARYGTDPIICDLPRVMRLPGFWHQKADAYQVRIVEATERRYSADELREWIKNITPEPELIKPDAVRRSTLNGSTSNYVKVAVESALANIANAGKGNRNNSLNSEAYGIFSLVKGGHVPETIREDIERVALSVGLAKSEVKATLKSAWEACRPRDPPEPRYRTNHQELPPHDPETGEVHEDEPPKKEKKKERPIHLKWDDLPFRMLGHNMGLYFYLPKSGGQVVALKSHEHTKLRLLAIADLNHWQAASDTKDTISENQWVQIANGLIQTQHQEGIFEETRMRGRGAWIDNKRVMVHTGSEVIVDNVPTPIMNVNSRFVYQAASPWDFGFGDAASTSEAHRLVDICERLTWEDEISGPLLAGWCVVAPVSGALWWRPHVWINGPAGSGKSAAQVDIVGRVVGPSAMRFEGKTTEAAIRQNMGFDARPVILDEAEGEDQDGVKRMQGILDLARVSSSGGIVSKGSASHRAVNFIARSCFCFSSIHSSIKHHADESRITRLILRKNSDPDKDEHYRQLMLDINAWFTPEYASRMFARTVENLPTLLKNCDVFTAAASTILGSRRAADQLGAMLAGLYLCHSSKPVTVETAEAFIRKHNWNDHLALDSQEDHVRLFSYIVSRMIRVMTNDGPREITIGQAIEDGSYHKELGPRGIRADNRMIWISNKSDQLSEMLREKPQWQSDWKRVLGLMKGAEKSAEPVYFAPGLLQRAIGIPREALR